MHFNIPSMLRLSWKGSTPLAKEKIISYVRARRLISRGCLGFIATVGDTEIEEITLDSVPVVCEFIDVFSRICLVCRL